MFKMNGSAKKLIVAYCVVCVLVARGSCFHEHIRMLSSKASELFGKKPCAGENDTIPPVWEINHKKPTVTLQYNDTDGDKPLSVFGIEWSRVSTDIANNWWIIALSSLLPLIVFWRIQHNMKKKLQEWKRSFIQKENVYNYSRRLTLPDLTLAKHARRESLAEATMKLSNHPRKLSQSNSLQFRNMNHNLFERNDDTPGESKRAHKIRRH